MFKKFVDISDLKNEDLSFLLNSYIKDIGNYANNDGSLRLLHITTDKGSFVIEKNIELKENNLWLEAIIIDNSYGSTRDTIIINNQI